MLLVGLAAGHLTVLQMHSRPERAKRSYGYGFSTPFWLGVPVALFNTVVKRKGWCILCKGPQSKHGPFLGPFQRSVAQSSAYSYLGEEATSLCGRGLA